MIYSSLVSTSFSLMAIAAAVFVYSNKASAASLEIYESEDDEAWANFKKEFGKFYEDPEEDSKRKRKFLETRRRIEEFNMFDSWDRGFELGLSELSDWLDEEFDASESKSVDVSHKRLVGGRTKTSDGSDDAICQDLMHLDAPAEVDWRLSGRVTPVRAQGRCGSCWAFAAIGVIEGQMEPLLGPASTVPLSVQNLLDCTPGNGCDGGFTRIALDNVPRMGGVQTEESYPYTGQKGVCRFDSKLVAMNISGVVEIPLADDQECLKRLIANYGPVATGIDAKSFELLNYKRGVFNNRNCDSEESNHGFLIVGYGTTESNVDYWIVKNSWGQTWGEDGYIRITRDMNQNCGIGAVVEIAKVGSDV